MSVKFYFRKDTTLYKKIKPFFFTFPQKNYQKSNHFFTFVPIPIT